MSREVKINELTFAVFFVCDVNTGKYECKAPDVTSNNMTFDEAKLFLKFEFVSIH